MNPDDQNPSSQQPPTPGQPPAPQMPGGPQPQAPQQPPQPGSQPGGPVISPVEGGGSTPSPQMSPDPSPKGKKMIVAVIVAVVLALGVGGYFLFFSGDDSVRKASNAAQESSDEADASAVDLSTLSDVAFEAGEFPGYQKDTSRSDTTYSQYANSEENCGLVYGTFPASQFPGNSPEQIAGNQIDDLRETGVTVSDPEAGEALILKDSNDPSVTYKLPTVTYTAEEGQDHVTFNFSFVTLKSGERAIVNRFCANNSDGQPVTAEKMNSLEAATKEITVVNQ